MLKYRYDQMYVETRLHFILQIAGVLSQQTINQDKVYLIYVKVEKYKRYITECKCLTAAMLLL